MEEKLLDIIVHYGVLSQLEYLQTEMVEFIEAVAEYELAKEAIDENDNQVFSLKSFEEHIKEELADNLVMLHQVKVFYDCNIDLGDLELSHKVYDFKQLKQYAKEVYRLSVSVFEAEKFREQNDHYNIFDIVGITSHLEKVLTILECFRQLYDISQEDLEKVMEFKVDRQIERIENENKRVQEIN
jgi:NTP pyrophosphatase (non-canonical NTP hydrolase)